MRKKNFLGVARKFRGWKGLLDVSYVYVPPFLPPYYYKLLMQWYEKYDVFDFEESATTLSSSSWIDLPMRQKIIKKNRRNLPSCTSLVDPRLTLWHMNLKFFTKIFCEGSRPTFWKVKISFQIVSLYFGNVPNKTTAIAHPISWLGMQQLLQKNALKISHRSTQ